MAIVKLGNSCVPASGSFPYSGFLHVLCAVKLRTASELGGAIEGPGEPRRACWAFALQLRLKHRTMRP